MTEIVKDEEHALMSGSRLQRIIDCPGSYAFARKFEKGTSKYADRGSFLHDKMKISLYHLNGKTITVDDLPVSIYFEDCTVEENWALEYCLDFLRVAVENLILDGEEVVMFVEVRTSLHPFDPILEHVSGTADIALHTPTKVHIVDWKFGQGVYVSVEQNDQLLSYGLGSVDGLDSLNMLKAILVSICQPFLENVGTEEWHPPACKAWLLKRVIPGIMAALREDAEFNPGEKQCKFCDGKMVCETRINGKHQIAADIFAGQMVPFNEVPIETIAEMLTRAKELKYYIGELEKYAKSVILNGGDFPNFKMVEGRSTRAWGVPEADVIQTLESHGIWADQYYESKLVSPAKAEKLKKGLKPVVAALVVKKAPTWSLVPADDPRPAIDLAQAADVFQHLLENENDNGFDFTS